MAANGPPTVVNAQQALQTVLAHPGMSLEQKIDAFKKLRQDGKITETVFKQILQVLGKYHNLGAQRAPQQAIDDAQKAKASTSHLPSPAQMSTTQTTPSMLKRKLPDDNGPVLSAEPIPYHMSASVAPPRTDPQAWPNGLGQRPTMTGGIASGMTLGTPSVIARVPEDVTILLSGDLRHGPKKSQAAEQSMRRTIQDLVSSIDPNVKIEPEVEDLLLEVADEFIDSVANFSCRLAKHRGGESLETRDLQLHLERNHNIRIPGFASDETRLSISQSAVLPQTNVAQAAKKAGQGTHMTLRSARLNAVSQAKRDNKLM